MDWINGAFELFGAGAMIPSLWLASSKKSVHGVHISTPLFFTAWGLWNLIFYPSVGAWFSTGAGVVVMVVNGLWLYLVWKYGNWRSQ